MESKLKFLVVASDIGNSAPGIVFRVLLNSLCKIADCQVLAPKSSSDVALDSNVDILYTRPYTASNWNRIKEWWTKYRINPKDEIWSRLVFCQSIFKLVGRKYDAVVSFTSMNYFASIKLGLLLSRFFQTKWIIYSVDGLPSPKEWLNDDKVHTIISSALDRTCRKADMFFSSNHSMMEYQNRILKSFRGKMDYIYTPYDKSDLVIDRHTHNGSIFLYTGSIYGIRRINGLLAGFRKFLEYDPDAKFVFVGVYSLDLFAGVQDLINSGSIELHPYSRNILPYYERADVLVDIGADISNDIFLSSKIVTYLTVNRPIIAISGDNSPVRDIFGNASSIFHSHNDPDEVFESMKLSVSCNNLDDRPPLLELFNPDNIAIKFLHGISSCLRSN